MSVPLAVPTRRERPRDTASSHPTPQQLLRSVGKDSLDFTSEFAKARPTVLEADTTFLDLQDHQAVLPRDQSIAFGVLASDERSIVGIGLVWVSGILL